jgi:hypothetical protein
MRECDSKLLSCTQGEFPSQEITERKRLEGKKIRKILTWTNVTFCVELFFYQKILNISAILMLAEV